MVNQIRKIENFPKGVQAIFLSKVGGKNLFQLLYDCDLINFRQAVAAQEITWALT